MRRRWLRVRPDGATETVLQNGIPDGEGWALVPVEVTGEAGAHPDRFCPSADAKSVEKRIEVRLSMSTDRFCADGEDEAVFMVIPECREATVARDIALEVNGERITVQPSEAIPIRSTKLGAFRVRLVDPRFFTMASAERVTRAVEPSRYEEEMEHVRTRQSLRAASRARRRGG